MNITNEKKTNLTEELTIEIGREDYAAKIEDALKNQRRKAAIPGFRPGNAPMGMIKKMYYKTFLADEINRIISESLFGYLKDNKVDIILEPIAVEEKSKADFDNEETFVFVFEYALKPEFELDFKKLPAVNRFIITASEKEINEYIEQLRKRYGEYFNPEIIGGEDDDITIKYGEDKTGYLHFNSLNEEGKTLFSGKKLHDKLTVSLKTIFTKASDFAILMRMDEKDIDPENDYCYEIEIISIGGMKPAELDENFFQKAFADGSITNEEELRMLAIRNIESSWAEHTSRFFMNDAINAIIDGITFELPDDFIKRFLLTTQENLTPEMIENDFENVKKSYRWQLIENRIATNFQLSVTEEEVRNHIRNFFIVNYFSQFNPENIQDHLNQLVNDAMKNQEDVKKIYDQLFDKKMEVVLVDNMNIEEQRGDFNDFMALMDKKQKDKDEEKNDEGEKEKKHVKKSTKTTKKKEVAPGSELEIPFEEPPVKPKKEKKTTTKENQKEE